MISAQEEIKRRKNIADQASKLASIDYRSLYRTDELGTQTSFEAASEVFARIFALLKFITPEGLALLPFQVLDRVERFLQGISQALDQIRAFRVDRSSNPLNDRNQLVGRLDAEYNELFRDAPAAAILVGGGSSGREELAKEAEAKLARITTIEQDLEKKAATQTDQAEEILNKMRAASGKVALQAYSEFFQTEADAAKKTAVLWLWATCISSAIMLWYLIWLVFCWAKAVPDYTVTQALQVAGTKIALFTVGFYLISWCGRNFKAQWHTRIVNSHRANTLNALEAFSNSAKNEQTREAILIHASSAIFAQANTGFIPDQSDAPNAPSILEIVRSGKEG